MLKEYKRPEDNKTKEELKAETKLCQEYITAKLQNIKESKLPIIVLVEGWSAAGKGRLINELISEIDPRFFKVYNSDTFKDGDRYPFLYPYFNAIPENGKFVFMDSGWLEGCVTPYVRDEIKKKEYDNRIRSVNQFERQLRDNGYLVLKIFVNISEETQKERLDELEKDKNTSWRATGRDHWQNDHYEKYQKAFDDFMENTSSVTPWNIVDGTKGTKLKHDAFTLLKKLIDQGLKNGKYCGEPFEADFEMTPEIDLDKIDLSVSISDEEYKKQLNELQDRISELHNVIYRKKIPFVVCFEGWDAAGKGGNIRRLAKPLDPRGFEVFPIASPEPHELARHYLWRFWTRLPKSGHFAIFDRTWYGRVMVERLEGYCSEKDWKRAYNEMNEFEEELTNWGAVVLKFWIQIDSDTQLERFTLRQNTPEKQWKITDEDWRNREKWPQYKEAITEMLNKTSTTFAPWHVIESVDKKYARIKVLRIVKDAMEKAIKEHDND